MHFALPPQSAINTSDHDGTPSGWPDGASAEPSGVPAVCGGHQSVTRAQSAAAACRLAQEIAGLGFDVPLSEIRRPSRAGNQACDARHVAMYLANTSFQISLSKIALAFGRERTSIAHAVRRIEDWRDEDAFDLRLQRLEEVAIAACRAAAMGLSAEPDGEGRR